MKIVLNANCHDNYQTIDVEANGLYTPLSDLQYTSGVKLGCSTFKKNYQEMLFLLNALKKSNSQETINIFVPSVSQFLLFRVLIKRGDSLTQNHEFYAIDYDTKKESPIAKDGKCESWPYPEFDDMLCELL